VLSSEECFVIEEFMLRNSVPFITFGVTDHAAACFIATSVREVVSIVSWERCICPFFFLIHCAVEIVLKVLMIVHDKSAGVIDTCVLHCLGKCEIKLFHVLVNYTHGVGLIECGTECQVCCEFPLHV
jgi:hypothetical protein